MKLYHYIHCPFCLRVRMALGFLEISYTSVPLPYDDEKTPVDLCDKKMLPIFQWSPGDQSNESLDIIARLDADNKLGTQTHYGSDNFNQLDKLTDRLAGPIHNMTMPYWIWTKEFDEKSRVYFQTKKEKKRGPFHLLVQRQNEFREQLAPILEEAEALLTPYFCSDKLTILDIILASHIWGLYILPEFQFSKKLHNYLQTVKKECAFNYHEDLWKTNEPLNYDQWRN